MMNIKIAKVFRTLSYEALCVLAGVRPIQLAIEEKVRTYKATHTHIEYDAPLEVRYWPRPAEIPLIRAPTEISHNVINIFTGGSKIGGKVEAAAVIIQDDTVLHQSQYKLYEKCSNNQAEQVAILKALEQLLNLQLPEESEKTAVVNTDSKVTLDTLQNRNKHYILIDKIRKEIKMLEDLRWTVEGTCLITRERNSR
jgi:ribonuclease HI